MKKETVIMLSPYTKDIKVVRVVVLLEQVPGGNQYSQITLTKDQFMKFSDCLSGLMETKEDGFIVECEEAVYTLSPETTCFIENGETSGLSGHVDKHLK